jgi:hypothetical protein
MKTFGAWKDNPLDAEKVMRWRHEQPERLPPDMDS